MDEKLANSSRIKGIYKRTLKKQKEKKEKKPEMDSNLKITQNESFIIIINTNKANYSLYKYQIFDTGSNTYIINYYEELTNVREVSELSVFNKRRNIYRIKAYKNVKVNLIILDGLFIITLLNIVYVPGYIINIIAIKRFSRGGIYWSSFISNIFIYGGEVFVNLEIIG